MQSLHRVGKSHPPVAQATLWHEISRLGVSIAPVTFIPYRPAAPLEMTGAGQLTVISAGDD